MNDAILTLLKKARESQQAAILLLRDDHPDFAASRAYYAMFYAAQALLLDKELSFSSHAAVIAAFGKEFTKTGLLDKRLHRFLLDAQDERNIGDYGTGPGVSAARVQEMLRWTEEFLTAAETYLGQGTGR